MADTSVNSVQQSLQAMLDGQRQTFNGFQEDFQKNRARLQSLWDDGSQKANFIQANPQLSDLQKLLLENQIIIPKVLEYAKALLARITTAVQTELNKDATT